MERDGYVCDVSPVEECPFSMGSRCSICLGYGAHLPDFALPHPRKACP